MAKRVLRYTEEEFITLLENIVNKVKAEQKRIDEARNINSKRINETRTSNLRKNSNQDRFRRLK